MAMLILYGIYHRNACNCQPSVSVYVCVSERETECVSVYVCVRLSVRLSVCETECGCG